MAAPLRPAEANDLGEERLSRGSIDGEGGHFEADVDLLLSPDGLGATVCFGATCTASPNCLFFWDEAADYVLRNGTATLTWTAASPTAAELLLEVQADPPLSRSGASPLLIEFEELKSDPSNGGVFFRVDHQLPNVPVQQEAVLRISFDFEGDLPSSNRGTCSDGLP